MADDIKNRTGSGGGGRGGGPGVPVDPGHSARGRGGGPGNGSIRTNADTTEAVAWAKAQTDFWSGANKHLEAAGNKDIRFDVSLFKQLPGDDELYHKLAGAARLYLHGTADKAANAGLTDQQVVEQAVIQLKNRKDIDPLSAVTRNAAEKKQLEDALQQQKTLSASLVEIDKTHTAEIKTVFEPLLKRINKPLETLNKPETVALLRPLIAGLGEQEYQKVHQGIEALTATEKKMEETIAQLQAIENRPDVKKLAEHQLRDLAGIYALNVSEYSAKTRQHLFRSDAEKLEFWNKLGYKTDFFADDKTLSWDDPGLRNSWSVLHAAQNVYQMENQRAHRAGIDPLMRDIGQLSAADKNKLIENAHSKMAWFNNNVLGMGNDLIELNYGKTTQEQKAAFMYLLDIHDKTSGGFWYAAGLNVLDPTNLIGLGTFGLETAGAKAAKEAATTAVRLELKAGLKQSLVDAAKEAETTAVRLEIKAGLKQSFADTAKTGVKNVLARKIGEQVVKDEAGAIMKDAAGRTIVKDLLLQDLLTHKIAKGAAAGLVQGGVQASYRDAARQNFEIGAGYIDHYSIARTIGAGVEGGVVGTVMGGGMVAAPGAIYGAAQRSVPIFRSLNTAFVNFSENTGRTLGRGFDALPFYIDRKALRESALTFNAGPNIFDIFKFGRRAANAAEDAATSAEGRTTAPGSIFDLNMRPEVPGGTTNVVDDIGERLLREREALERQAERLAAEHGTFQAENNELTEALKRDPALWEDPEFRARAEAHNAQIPHFEERHEALYKAREEHVKAVDANMPAVEAAQRKRSEGDLGMRGPSGTNPEPDLDLHKAPSGNAAGGTRVPPGGSSAAGPAPTSSVIDGEILGETPGTHVPPGTGGGAPPPPVDGIPLLEGEVVDPVTGLMRRADDPDPWSGRTPPPDPVVPTNPDRSLGYIHAGAGTEPERPSPVGKWGSLIFALRHGSEYGGRFRSAARMMDGWAKPIQDLGATMQSNNSVNLALHMNPSLAAIGTDDMGRTGVRFNFVFEEVVKDAATGQPLKNAEGNIVVRPVVDLLGSLQEVKAAADHINPASLETFSGHLETGSATLIKAAEKLETAEQKSARVLALLQQRETAQLAPIENLKSEAQALKTASERFKEELNANRDVLEAKQDFDETILETADGRAKEILITARQKLDRLNVQEPSSLVITDAPDLARTRAKTLSPREQQAYVRNIYRDTAQELAREAGKIEQNVAKISEDVAQARQKITGRFEQKRQVVTAEVAADLQTINQKLQASGTEAKSSFQPVVDAVQELQKDYAVVENDITSIHADPRKTKNMVGGTPVARMAAANAEPHLEVVAGFGNQIDTNIRGTVQAIDAAHQNVVAPLNTIVTTLEQGRPPQTLAQDLRGLASTMSDGHAATSSQSANPLGNFDRAFALTMDAYQKAENAVMDSVDRKYEKDAGWGLFTGTRGGGASHWLRHRDSGLFERAATSADIPLYQQLASERRVLPFYDHIIGPDGKPKPLSPDEVFDIHYRPYDSAFTDNTGRGNGRWSDDQKWIDFAHDNPGRIGRRDFTQPNNLREAHGLITDRVIEKAELLLDPVKNGGRPNIDAYRDVTYRWLTLNYNRGSGAQRAFGISTELISAMKKAQLKRPEIWTPQLIAEAEHMQTNMTRLGANSPRIWWEEVLGFTRNRIFFGDYDAELRLGKTADNAEEYESAMGWKYGHGIEWLARIQSKVRGPEWYDRYAAHGERYHSGFLWTARSAARFVWTGPPFEGQKFITPFFENRGRGLLNAAVQLPTGGVLQLPKLAADAKPTATAYIPRFSSQTKLGTMALTAAIATGVAQKVGLPADPGGWFLGQTLGTIGLVQYPVNWGWSWATDGKSTPEQEKLHTYVTELIPNRDWQKINLPGTGYYPLGKPRTGILGWGAPETPVATTPPTATPPATGTTTTTPPPPPKSSFDWGGKQTGTAQQPAVTPPAQPAPAVTPPAGTTAPAPTPAEKPKSSFKWSFNSGAGEVQKPGLFDATATFSTPKINDIAQNSLTTAERMVQFSQNKEGLTPVAVTGRKDPNNEKTLTFDT